MLDKGDGDEARIYIRSEQSQVGVGGGRLGGYLLEAQDHGTGVSSVQDFQVFFSFAERLLHERAN